jgi:hypothetical protein
MSVREETWRRLGSDLKPAGLSQAVTEIGLDGLPDAFATLLKGGARGRYIVKLD